MKRNLYVLGCLLLLVADVDLWLKLPVLAVVAGVPAYRALRLHGFIRGRLRDH